MSEPNIVLLLFAGVPILLMGMVVASVILGRREPRRAAPAWVGKIALFLLVPSLVLLALESYYRFVYDTTDAYQAGLISQRWVSRYYELNNFGVRDDVDYSPEPPAGRTRVTFVGDSYTNGHGVPDVRDRFVNRIRDVHPDWDVQMIAEDGLDTGAIVQRLDSLKVRGEYRLGLVVYMYCLNDISDLIQELSAATATLYDERPGLLVRGSYLLNTYYYRLRIGRDPVLSRYFDLLAGAYRDRRWTSQTRRLARLRGIVEQGGGELLVVTLPFFELEGSQEYRDIHRQLAELWREAGVPNLDLRESFSEYDLDELTVNRHDTHPNEFAHGLAAAEIGEFIEKSLPPALEGD